jgi:hypothetical protein
MLGGALYMIIMFHRENVNIEIGTLRIIDERSMEDYHEEYRNIASGAYSWHISYENPGDASSCALTMSKVQVSKFEGKAISSG